MKPVPKIGEIYPLFDDGKLNDTRLYYGEVTRILTVEEAKTEIVKHLEKTEDDYVLVERTLYDVWKQEILDADFLFSQDTDYFVEISVPDYDENLLWAVRTKEGGWFTMDIQSDWQGCEVDVDRSLLEQMEARYEEYAS